MPKEIIVAAGPVIIENGKVLLNKHGEDKFWKFLGGRVEVADFSDPVMTLEEACKREAKEENGFDIEIIRPLKPMLIQKPASRSDEINPSLRSGSVAPEASAGRPGSPDTWLVLIHFLAKRIGEIHPVKSAKGRAPKEQFNRVKLGADILDFKEFEVEKLLSGGYPDEQFAPNIVPVLRDYLKS